MKHPIRYGVVIAIAVFLSSLSLKPLTTDMAFLRLGAMAILVIGLVTVVLRRINLREPWVVLAQIVTFTVFLFGTATALGDEGSLLGRVGSLYRSGIGELQSSVAPLPPHPGVTLLLVTGTGLIALLTHILVQSVERPAWSLLSLLTLFLIPALGLKEDISAWYLVLIGLGYLMILFVEGLDRTGSWARNLVSATAGEGRTWPSTGRMAVLIGVPALGLTLLLGSVIPLPGQVNWNLSKPKGNDGPLQLNDPTLDLRRNLSRPEDRVVMTYLTDNPDGQYLRLASLSQFDEQGWQIVPMQLQSRKELPPAPGLTADPAGTTVTDVSIGDFPSDYLPAPYAPRSHTAEGSWSYDPLSLTILATGPDRAQETVNLKYSVTSDEIEPDGARLSAARPGRPPDAEYTMALPPDLPEGIMSLTTQVTKDAQSPALKAAAIQKFLRSDAFTYSLEPQPGTGYDALENFLLRDRTGYCEQFAASMAIMARIVGIPSRVSVGFLPGEKAGDHWEVSLHDMHAWPELYFEGEGWVRFEPTPAVQAGAAPPWTIEGEAPPTTATPTPEPTPTGEPTAEPTAGGTPSATPTPSPEATAGGDEEGSGLPLTRILTAVGAVALVVALAAIPGLVRRRIRGKRLADRDDPHEAVDQAWAEVRATLVDLGKTWQPLSPRAQARRWGEHLPTEASAALRDLSRTVERSRYAAHLEDVDSEQLRTWVTTIRSGLMERSARDARFTANWWPRSIMSRRSRW